MMNWSHKHIEKKTGDPAFFPFCIRKGKTAGQYEEQRYWHRGASDNGAVRDADKAAQDTWARSQQNANVIRINGGKTALDEIE